MQEIVRMRPEIPLDAFLWVFLSGGLVIFLGVFYVGIYTLVKMGKLHKNFMPFAYLFWGFQAYCLYYLSTTIQSGPFIQKVLIVAMIGYLILPHLYYYLMVKVDDRYEQK